MAAGFFDEIKKEEADKSRQLHSETSLGAATAFEPANDTAPAGGFFNDVAKEENDKVSKGLQLAAQYDPDQYATAKAIADRDGLPVDYTLSNLPELKKRETVSKMRGILEQNEGLREWFKQQDNGALVKLPDLERYHGVTYAYELTKESLSSSSQSLRVNEIRAAQLFGRATPEQIAEADKADASQQETGATGFSSIWESTMRQLPVLGDLGLAAGRGAIEGGSIGSVAGALAGGVGAAPGAAVGASIGATARTTEANYNQHLGELASDFFRIRDEDGKPLDPTVIKLAAVAGATINTGFDMLSLGILTRNLPIIKELGPKQLQTLFRSGMTGLLKNPTTRAALLEFAKESGVDIATEVTTETAQQVVQMALGEAAKLATGGNQTYKTGAEWVEGMTDAAAEAFKATLLLGPAMQGPKLFTDLTHRHQAERTPGFVETLVKAAEKDDLLDKNPAKAKEAFGAALGDKIKSLFVPSEKLAELFQSININPADLEKEIPGFTQSFNTALVTGGDVEIATPDFYASFAKARPDLALGLKDHLRMDAEGETAAEAAYAMSEAGQADRQKAFEEDLAALKAEQESSAPAEKVFQDVKDKLISAGRSADSADAYAQLYRDRFRVLEHQSEGKFGSAWDLYAQYGLGIKFAFPEQLSYNKTDDIDLLFDDLRAGRDTAVTRERNKALGPSLSTFLRSKGGLQDSGGELKSRDVSGTLNAKSGKGMNLDDAALAAWEAGYFPDHAENRPSIDDLLGALDRELSGDGVYRNGLTPDSVDLQSDYLTRLDTMGRTLSELGLDPASMSNVTLRQELEAVINQDAEQGALFQIGSDLGGPRADKRGSIQFSQDKSRTIINLFEQADLSTFLHESGHFFLEVTRDMALREGAPDAIKQDWATIKEWLGLESDEIPVDAHETFARGFEAYLFEGKAPSEGLRSAFASFRSWLLGIYRKISRLQVNVTPEIKAVFDRMLASEEEIAAADQTYKMIAATAEEAKALGVDGDWFAKQTELAEKSRAEALTAMQVKMLADVKRETTREWQENKKAVRAEVLAEFSKMPVYQVMHYLLTGQAISDDVTVPGGRMVIDSAYVKERYGKEGLTRLPRGVPPIYADPSKSTRKDVAIVHPDILAEAFGYESGDALIQDLWSAPPIGVAVVEETNLRMRNRYGDLLTDLARRSQEALAAVHTDSRAQFLENEMRALYKKSRQVLAGQANAEGAGFSASTPLPARQVIAAWARDSIAMKRTADAIRVGMYMKQEQRLAKEVEKAILAGDFKTAADLKRRQLMSHYLALEARRAKEDVEAATRYLNRFGNRKRPASVDPDYLDQIEGMLERYDLRPSTSLRDISKRKKLADFIQEQENLGNAIAIPDSLRDESRKVSYKDLTIEGLRALTDSVRNLEHLGRLKNKLLVKGRALAFQNVKDELTAAAAANVDKRKAIKGYAPDKWEKLNLSVLSAAATMARIEQVVEWLDGGDVNGPWRRYVWAPLADAQAKEAALRDATMAPLLAVWDSFPKGYLAESYHIQSSGRSLKKAEIFALALNTGTQSNFDRLLAGEKIREGGGHDTQAKLDEAFSHLTKADWDAIQKIWDQIDSLWPEASALQKRQTGLASTKIEEREVVTPHGTYKGGYYPLVYDTSQTTDPAAVLLNKGELTMDPQHTQIGRNAGHMKERVATFEQPLSVNLDVINRHIEKVIHDITHWEAVKETNKILMDPEIEVSIRQQLGKPFHEEFKKWLKRNWFGDDLGDVSAFQRILGRVRSNAGIYALAYRWTTVVTQFAGFGPSAARVGVKPLAAAMKQYWLAGPSDPREGGARNAVEDFVFGKSSEMKNRASSIDRDIRLGLSKLEGKSGALSEAQRFGFAGIAMADRWVSVPTWLGGYNAHLEQFPSDEAGAVEAGDRAVRLSQGAGGTKDIASIQADPNFQLLTMFYGPFNVLFNNLWTLGKDAGKLGRGATYEQYRSVFFRAAFFVIIPAVMADLLTGRGPDDDDKDKEGTARAYATWAAAKVALYPLATIPILRDAASYLGNGFESNPNPAARIVNAGAKVIKETGKGRDANPRVIAKNTVDAVGMAAGLPVGAVVSSGNNAWRHAQEGDFRWLDFLFSRK